MTCTTPRCNQPAVGTVGGRWWPMCPPHALVYAQSAADRASQELWELRARLEDYPIDGQLDLLGTAT